MAGIALSTPARSGATILSARRREGLTQAQLAERAGGVSRRWLISLEQGGKSERAELGGKILDTLDALGLDLSVTPPARRRSNELTDLLGDL